MCRYVLVTLLNNNNQCFGRCKLGSCSAVKSHSAVGALPSHTLIIIKPRPCNTLVWYCQLQHGKCSLVTAQSTKHRTLCLQGKDENIQLFCLPSTEKTLWDKLFDSDINAKSKTRRLIRFGYFSMVSPSCLLIRLSCITNM